MEKQFLRKRIDTKTLSIPSARIPLEKAAPLRQPPKSSPKKPFIGLDTFNQAPTLQADTMATSILARRNLYQALQRMGGVIHVICDGVDIVMQRQDDAIQVGFFVCEADKNIMPPEPLDSAFLIILNKIKQGLSPTRAIRYVGFQRERPSAEQYQHLIERLGIDVKSDCDCYHLCVDWKIAKNQNPYWNPALADASEALAHKDLQQLEDVCQSRRSRH